MVKSYFIFYFFTAQNAGNSTDGINQRAADKILRLFDLQIIYITATLME
jgi:hypothetical protein